MRVILLKQFAKENFPSTPLLDYALEVEKITTTKKIEHPYKKNNIQKLTHPKWNIHPKIILLPIVITL